MKKINNKRLIYALLFVPLIFWTLKSCQSAKSDEINKRISSVILSPEIDLIINTDAPGDSLALIGRVDEIKVTKLGKIYLSDVTAISIHKFDPHGNYLNRIGRRGRGTGELMGISAFQILPENKIIVTDEVNRRILAFGETKVEDTYQAPVGTDFPSGKFTAIQHEDTTYYLFLYKLHENLKDSDCLFHLFERTFTRKLACYGNFKTLKFSNENVINYLTQAIPGHFKTDEEQNIYYAPRFYAGAVFKYSYDETENSWSKAEKWPGIIYEEKPINPDAEPLDYRLTFKGQRYRGQINNRSRGLFVKDSTILHFTSILKQGGDTQFGVEVFNKENGELLSYNVIDMPSNYDDDGYEVAAMDSSGNFYFKGESDSVAVLRVQFPKLEQYF